ncbi:MAG: nucleotide exchange factor GrpE [Acidobacteria bacterium]|nr:MAG: nucleotide exchange factor GrpE [Acidobacteriota bacterium]
MSGFGATDSKQMDEREHESREPREGVIEFNSRSRTGQEGADLGAGAHSTEGADVASLTERLARLQTEKDELMQTLVRRQADFENYRKRVERERQEDRRHGIGRLIEDLLPVLDAFERALKAHDDPAYEEYRKGLDLIYRQLWDTLARHGLERIVASGKPFDPYYHQAIERVESAEHPEGTILDVLQDGFLFHGRVVRPSVVRVSFSASQSDGGKSSVAQRNSK